MATDGKLKSALDHVVRGNDLDEETAHEIASSIMEGQLRPAQIAAILVALRMKGETVSEISGFVRAMRQRAEPVPVSAGEVVDTCGTGGDGKSTFNISTVCAFVAAGAGCKVAKHGNRSVSSLCGSSEVLEALGVKADMGPEKVADCIRDFGVGFLFAPRYHKATRHAAEARGQIGIRSIFNLVGPLTNPAAASRQLMGVFSPEWTEPAARVLREHGSTHCMVVHGEDGLDEITLDGCTRVSELKNGKVSNYRLDPASLGFRRRPLDDLRGGDPAANAQIALDVLGGKKGGAREIVILNAAAVTYVGGVASSLEQGVELASRSIDSGRALAALDSLRARSEQEDA